VKRIVPVEGGLQQRVYPITRPDFVKPLNNVTDAVNLFNLMSPTG
jgi:hypothetical protein